MRMTILNAGMSQPHAGWAAIDEFATLLSEYFDAPIVSPRPLKPPAWQSMLGKGSSHWERVPPISGDVLMVVARGPDDLSMLRAIPDVKKRFSRVVAWVTDSYFQAGFPRDTALFDAITVTAPEDSGAVSTRFGIPAHNVFQGIDGLRWAPRHWSPRAVDVIAFGRTPPSYHEAFASHFHAESSPFLYLHSPLGNLRGPTVQRERGMLMKLLHRSAVSLAFHLYVEPEGDRPRSMMVTSRWLESLVSGCIVAGKRPISSMADAMLDWPDCTVELADEPRLAVDQVEALLRGPDLLAVRQRNVAECLLRHDWRWRIRDLCALFGWETPARLANDLEAIGQIAAQVRAADA